MTDTTTKTKPKTRTPSYSCPLDFSVTSLMSHIYPSWSNIVILTIDRYARAYEYTKDAAGQPIDFADCAQLTRYMMQDQYNDLDICHCLVPALAADWAASTQARNITPTSMRTAKQELAQTIIRRWNGYLYNILKTLDIIGPDTQHAGRVIDWDDRDQICDYVKSQNDLPGAVGCQMAEMIVDNWLALLDTPPPPRHR